LLIGFVLVLVLGELWQIKHTFVGFQARYIMFFHSFILKLNISQPEKKISDLAHGTPNVLGSEG